MAKVPGVPGLSLPPSAEERRAAEIDAAAEIAMHSSSQQFGSSVRVQYGRFRLVVPWMFVALLAGGGGVFAVEKSRTPDAPVQSADYAAVVNKQIASDADRQRAEATAAIVLGRLEDRLATLETKISVLESQQTAILLAVKQR